MKLFTQWMQNRGRSNSAPPAPSLGSLERYSSNKLLSAITPGNVPEFVIPSHQKRAIMRTHSDGLISDVHTKLREEPTMPVRRKADSVPSQIETISITQQVFPHLKTETSSFGFTFVSEPVHTRRKESLLFDGHQMQLLHQFQRDHASRPTGDEPNTNQLEAMSQQQTRAKTVPQPKEVSLHGSNSLPNDVFSSDNWSRQKVGELEDEDKTGSILLMLAYNSKEEKLTVEPMQANYLTSQLNPVDCNSYVKVYLGPGKPMKKQTEVVRGNTAPTYISTLTFTNVTPADLEHKNVHVKVCNNTNSGLSLYNKTSLLGEVVFPLSELDLGSCGAHVTWRDLYTTSTRDLQLQCVGWVSTTMDLRHQEKQLYVTVTEVAGLHVKGTSAVYAVIDVHQDGGSRIHKKTQVKRMSIQQKFKETFAFSIEMEPLCSTQVNVKVMLKETLRADSIIGVSAITGRTCSERETFWSHLLNTPERKGSQWTELYPT